MSCPSPVLAFLALASASSLVPQRNPGVGQREAGRPGYRADQGKR
jgi:hypothetical protein